MRLDCARGGEGILSMMARKVEDASGSHCAKIERRRFRLSFERRS